jgi:DNA polymerase III epsilon subunit-like protein
MDKRKTYYLTIDTETAGTLDAPLVYDIGGCIHDKKGNVEETFSYTISDIFNSDLMETAYYYDKVPQYWQDIANGTRTVITFKGAKYKIAKLCKKYKVKAIIAHNAYFDYKALRNTMEYLTDGEEKYFLPYGVEIWDTLKMAKDTVGKTKTYIHFCEKNGYLTKYNKPRLTAEILFRYISNDSSFEESHTGLEDTLIEKEIFKKCMSYHKPMQKKLWKD